MNGSIIIKLDVFLRVDFLFCLRESRNKASEFIHFGAQKFKEKNTWNINQFCSKKVSQGKQYSGMLTHATDGSSKRRNPESGIRKRKQKRKRNTESNINGKKLKNFTLHNLVQSKENLF